MALIISALLTLSNTATAQEAEASKTCEFKDANLLFQSRLIRNKGVLTGYEVSIKNTGQETLQGLNTPLLNNEVAFVMISEKPNETNKLKDKLNIVSVDLKVYPMHGRPETAQKRYKGDLSAGEVKKYQVKLDDVLKPDYRMNADSIYDFFISFNFGFYPPHKSFEAAAAWHAPIRAEIRYSDCLAFKNVKLNEISGK